MLALCSQTIHYLRNIIHLKHKRFIPFAERVIGLSLEQAILDCRWGQNLSARVAEQTVVGAAVKAKALGLDLKRCYISKSHRSEARRLVEG